MTSHSYSTTKSTKRLRPSLYHPALCHLLLLLLLLLTGCTPELIPLPIEGGVPLVRVRNNPSGPVSITGQVRYTNSFFTLGIAQPLIILEDQAGFVDRNRRFLLPPESQTIGQIVTDFYKSPFTYTLSLPSQPQGSLRDVDQDGESETGVMVFAVAYWANIFGDPYLEERDLQGGGWSTAYASTRVGSRGEDRWEVTGGKLLVYAPDNRQSFPNGFGNDGKLFTDDDPIANLSSGYTVVNLDSAPFTFDRSLHPTIDLIEPDSAVEADFSSLGYSAAFDAAIEKLRKEYAFTDAKGIDWDTLHTQFRPRFEAAEADKDLKTYRLALHDFIHSIPDGHMAVIPFLSNEYEKATHGGLGMSAVELDDGRVLVSEVTAGGPADQVGIQPRAQLFAIGGKPINQAIDEATNWYGPAGTRHVQRINQLRFALRFPFGTEVAVTYRNPGSNQARFDTLVAQKESNDFWPSPTAQGQLPVTFEVLPSGYGYVRFTSFSDNELLTVQLWERMIRTAKEQALPGIILDMRTNVGGNGFLADQLAAYFFDTPYDLGITGHYDAESDQFDFDPRMTDRFYLPSDELRYRGKVAVLVGPECMSACEFFAYDLTIHQRAAVVGQYPSAGMGGSVEQFKMPEGTRIQFTEGRAVDMNGEVHIEGKGVVPTVKVPVNEETVFNGGDAVLEAAIQYLGK